MREQRQIAVVNAGISGNRIRHDVPALEYGPSALARLDRDVLSVAGVRTVFLLESINDIGIPGSSVLPEQTIPPSGPTRAAYDSGDHIRLNDLGYRKIADSVNLDTLIGKKRGVSR